MREAEQDAGTPEQPVAPAAPGPHSAELLPVPEGGDTVDSRTPEAPLPSSPTERDAEPAKAKPPSNEQERESVGAGTGDPGASAPASSTTTGEEPPHDAEASAEPPGPGVPADEPPGRSSPEEPGRSAAPADAEGGATPPSAKVRPTTLVTYLSAKAPAAPAFLEAREKAREDFEASDVEEAVGLVHTLDATFRKTLALTRAAFLRRTPAAISARDFAKKAVRREVASGPDPFAQEDCAEAIRVVSHGLRLRMASKPKQAQGIAVLTTALLLLSERPDFRVEAALGAFDEALARRLRSGREGSTPATDAMAFLASLAARPQDLDVAVGLAYEYAREAQDARRAAEAAEAAAVTHREKSEDLRARLDVAESALSDALRDAADLRGALDEARRQADEARRAASHDVAAVRRSVRAFMSGSLLPPLEVAAEAAEIEPPRVHIIEEQLDVASTRLRKEIARLERPEE